MFPYYRPTCRPALPLVLIHLLFGPMFLLIYFATAFLITHAYTSRRTFSVFGTVNFELDQI